MILMSKCALNVFVRRGAVAFWLVWAGACVPWADQGAQGDQAGQDEKMCTFDSSLECDPEQEFCDTLRDRCTRYDEANYSCAGCWPQNASLPLTSVRPTPAPLAPPYESLESSVQHPISSILEEYYSPNFTVGTTQLFTEVVGVNTLIPAIDQELAALEAFRHRLGLDGSPDRDAMLKALQILAKIDARHKKIEQASNLLKSYFDRVMAVCPPLTQALRWEDQRTGASGLYVESTASLLEHHMSDTVAWLNCLDLPLSVHGNAVGVLRRINELTGLADVLGFGSDLEIWARALDESILRNIETKLPDSRIGDSGWIRVQKSDLHASVMAALLSVEAVIARALLSYGWVGRFFDTDHAETAFFARVNVGRLLGLTVLKATEGDWQDLQAGYEAYITARSNALNTLRIQMTDYPLEELWKLEPVASASRVLETYPIGFQDINNIALRLIAAEKMPKYYQMSSLGEFVGCGVLMFSLVRAMIAGAVKAVGGKLAGEAIKRVAWEASKSAVGSVVSGVFAWMSCRPIVDDAAMVFKEVTNQQRGDGGAIDLAEMVASAAYIHTQGLFENPTEAFSMVPFLHNESGLPETRDIAAWLLFTDAQDLFPLPPGYFDQAKDGFRQQFGWLRESLGAPQMVAQQPFLSDQLADIATLVAGHTSEEAHWLLSSAFEANAFGVPYATAQDWVNREQSGLSWLSRSEPEAWLEATPTEIDGSLRTWLEQALGTLVYEQAAGTGPRLSAGLGDIVAETYGACTLASLQQYATTLGEHVGGVVQAGHVLGVPSEDTVMAPVTFAPWTQATDSLHDALSLGAETRQGLRANIEGSNHSIAEKHKEIKCLSRLY